MKRFLTLVIPGLSVLILSACGGHGGPDFGTSIGNAGSATDSHYLSMQADLANAKSLTLPIYGEGAEKRELLKVTYDGKLEKVFTGTSDIQFWKETPTHIIAQTNINENGQKCFLVAIPKVQSKTKVLCLSRERLQPHDERSNRARFDVRGSKVYFSTVRFKNAQPPYSYSGYYSDPEESRWMYSSSSNDPWLSEVWSWDGSSLSTHREAGFDQSLDHLPAIAQVFTAPNSEVLCFSLYQSYSGGAKGGQGMVVCRENDRAKWIPRKDITADDDAVKYGHWLLTTNSKLDLDKLTVQSRGGYSLPTYIYAALSKGGFIGTGGHSVVCVNGEGDSLQSYDVNYETRLVRVGNQAWFFGANELRKVSLDDCTLDTVDYLPNTGLMSISNISWLVGDYLRVDGRSTTSSEQATAFLKSDGSLFAFQKKEGGVAFDHPIDLHWDL